MTEHEQNLDETYNPDGVPESMNFKKLTLVVFLILIGLTSTKVPTVHRISSKHAPGTKTELQSQETGPDNSHITEDKKIPLYIAMLDILISDKRTNLLTGDQQYEIITETFDKFGDNTPIEYEEVKEFIELKLTEFDELNKLEQKSIDQ